jgi:hypothetical protein
LVLPAEGSTLLQCINLLIFPDQGHMATHQIGFARTLAQEILFMEKCRIVEHGSPATLLRPGPEGDSRTLDFCSTMSELYMVRDSNPYAAAVIGFTLCSGAYHSEYIRGSLLSIKRGTLRQPTPWGFRP